MSNAAASSDVKRLLAEGQKLFHVKDYKQAILFWQKVIKHPDASDQQRQAAEHCVGLLAPKLAVATRDTETFICPADTIDTMLVKAMVQPMEERHRVGEARDLVRSKQKTDRVLIAPLVPTAAGPTGMPVEISGLKRADRRPIAPDEASRTSFEPNATRQTQPHDSAAPNAEGPRTDSGALLPPPRPVTAPLTGATSTAGSRPPAAGSPPLPPNTVSGDSGSRRESEQLPRPPRRSQQLDDEDTHVHDFLPSAGVAQPTASTADKDVEDTHVGGDGESDEDTRIGADTGYKPAVGRLAGADRVTAIRDARWAQQIRERLSAAIPPDSAADVQSHDTVAAAAAAPAPGNVDLTPPQGSPAHVPVPPAAGVAPPQPLPEPARGEVVVSSAHLLRMEDLIRQQGRMIERLHEEMAQIVRRLALVELEISASVSDLGSDTSRRLNPATGSSGRIRSISDTQLRALTPIKPELPSVSTSRIAVANGTKPPSGAALPVYNGETTRTRAQHPSGVARAADGVAPIRPITSEFAAYGNEADGQAAAARDEMVVSVPADARRGGKRHITTEPLAADANAPANASFEAMLAAPVWPETTEVHLKGVSKAVDSIMEGVEQGAVPTQTAVHRLVRSVEVNDATAGSHGPPAGAAPPPALARPVPPPPPLPPPAAQRANAEGGAVSPPPLSPPLTPTPPPPPPARSPAATLPSPTARRVGSRQPSHG